MSSDRRAEEMSTFIRCLNLLEKPTGGDIVFEGVSLMSKKINLDEHRKKIGMVFQHFNLLPIKMCWTILRWR